MKYFLSSVEGNKQSLDGGAMFGNAPKALWSRWHPTDKHNRIKLSCRGLLIEFANKKVLCEVGIGNFFEPKLAERFGVEEANSHVLLDSLTKLGVAEEEIDYVILSHLHFDHAGALLPSYANRQKGITTLHFPNAKYIVSAQAWLRAQKPHPRDKASFIPELTNSLADSKRLIIIKEGQNKIDYLKDFSFFYSHGHTPGHMHTLVEGENEKVFFCGDLVPGVAWIHAPITMGYDRFPEKLIDEKKQFYKDAVNKKWWLFYTHDINFVASRCQMSSQGRCEAIDKQDLWQRKEI